MKPAPPLLGLLRPHVPITAAFVLSLASASPGLAQLASPSEAGVTWGHIHMNVTDVERHTRIWTEHFGGQLSDFELVRTIVLPNTIIMLSEREPTGGSVGSSLDHFGFSVPDVAAFLDRWRADGLVVESEFTGFGDVPQAYLTLPDGIRVELEEIPTLPRPAVPYHVHLYTDADPEALRDWFVEAFAMAPRERGRNPFTADVPGMNVSFSASDVPLEGSLGRSVDHVGFEIEGLEALTRMLEERGVTFDVPYREIGDGLALAFFTDASGTRWELTEGLDGIANDASGR